MKKGLASGALIGTSAFASGQDPKESTQNKVDKDKIIQRPMGDPEEIVIERPMPGKPHTGKVLLAIQAHSDDIPLFAGGLVAKLMDEGYTGYLLRTSDDSSGNYEGNRKDNADIAAFYGMKKAYDFMYKHHQMDAIQIQDLKARLIFLFRLLQVDTLICWDPWEHYEENPDHQATSHAVEAARWMAGMRTDYPEHLDAGLKPKSPREVYYYARTPQRANRIVDITNYIDKKVEANMVIVSQGGGGNTGSLLRKSLAKEGKKLPGLGDDDRTANFNYIKNFMLDMYSESIRGVPSDKKTGEKYGLEWAERFRYFGPASSGLKEYISENAQKL